MADKKIHLAVIGCGAYGRKRALSILKCSQQVCLATVYDIDQEKSKNLAMELGVPAAPSFESVFMDSCIDAAIVAVPNAYHVQVCTPLIENKKHILCEKPLSHTLDSAKKLYELVTHHKILFKSGSNFRNFPIITAISEMVKNGEIGTIRSLYGSIGHNGDIIKNKWNHSWEIAGGGTLLDNGIHLIDFFQDIAGEFIKSNFLKKKILEDGMEHYVLTKYATKDISEIIIESSWNKQDGYAEVLIEGSKGKLTADVHGNSITMTTHGKEACEIFIKEEKSSIDLELEYFIRCIQKNVQPEPSAKTALKTLEKIFMAYESNERCARV